MAVRKAKKTAKKVTAKKSVAKRATAKKTVAKRATSTAAKAKTAVKKASKRTRAVGVVMEEIGAALEAGAAIADELTSRPKTARAAKKSTRKKSSARR